MWQVLFRRRNGDQTWYTFGLPKASYDEACRTRDEQRKRFPDSEWKLELEASWIQQR